MIPARGLGRLKASRAAPDLEGARAEYDPAATTLRQRELAKAEELRAAGHMASTRTVIGSYRREAQRSDVTVTAILP